MPIVRASNSQISSSAIEVGGALTFRASDGANVGIGARECPAQGWGTPPPENQGTGAVFSMSVGSESSVQVTSARNPTSERCDEVPMRGVQITYGPQ
eukprot:4582692-Alexandrium_andersonii.AAC.1